MKMNSDQVEAFSAHECLTCSLAVHCSQVIGKKCLKESYSNSSWLGNFFKPQGGGLATVDLPDQRLKINETNFFKLFLKKRNL